MTGESIPSFPSSSGHGAALAARTLHAVAHDTPMRNPVGVAVRINAYGRKPDVVTAWLRRFRWVRSDAHCAYRGRFSDSTPIV